MTNRFFKIVLFFGIFLILFGCAAQQPVKEFPPFKPIDLNSRIKSGDYLQKVDYFQVILDASATTKGQEYQTARHLAKTMNLTIPDLDLKAGLRVFGTSGNRTDLVYGMVNYTQLGFDSAIPLIGGFGESPLGDSIAAAGLDLKQASNNMALIIFSDGLETEASSIDAANDLKKQYGDRLCIYAVNLGSSPRGRGVLEGVTKAAQCGFVVKAEEIQSPEGMAGFVEKVFLAKAPPKPEPVVPSLPPVPRPPSPPEPQEVPQPVYESKEVLKPVPVVPVAPRVKPLDSDGDGVSDDADKCPNTPAGAKVDREGCWVLPIIYFETDKWNIKKEFYLALNEVVTVLKKNPELKIVIEGHTDNQGKNSYNEKLSEKRAKEVQSYFIKAGVSRERLIAKAYSETRQAVPNTSPESMAKNRRVLLVPVK